MGRFATSAAAAEVKLPLCGDAYCELSIVFSSTSLSSSALFESLRLAILKRRKENDR